jgi:hypothetical protein
MVLTHSDFHCLRTIRHAITDISKNLLPFFPHTTTVCPFLTLLPTLKATNENNHSHISRIINTNLTRTWPNAVFCVVFGCQPKQQKIRRHANGVINLCTVSFSRRVSSHAPRAMAVVRPRKKIYEWFISLPREHHVLASVVRLTTCLSLMISFACHPLCWFTMYPAI